MSPRAARVSAWLPLPDARLRRLTTLANGRFSDNAFLMTPAKPLTIQFVPFGDLDLAKLKASLRVEHVAAYL